MQGASILWRRLDTPGHDACRLSYAGGEWLLEGSAVWRDPNGPAQVTYRVGCDDNWQPQRARVDGLVGDRAFALSFVKRRGDDWNVNGRDVPDTANLTDLDLGITPATNLIPLRRFQHMGQGNSAAIWLDDDWILKPLDQTYRRKAEGCWHYAARQTDFETVLMVGRDGFVTDYPGFWTKED